MTESAEPSKIHPTSLRSCYRCSQKKIRCSKTQPCGHCEKAGSECKFPGPGRAPRRKKRPLKAELMSRVRDLETELQILAKGENDFSPERVVSQTDTVHQKVEARSPKVQDETQGPGRLSVKGSSAQYFTHEILVNLETQIEGLKKDIELFSPVNYSVETSHGNDFPQHGNQFLFGFASIANSLEPFHPSMTQSQILWNVYEENVAPVLMIFHKPTLFKLIYKAASNIGYTDRESEAVVFAVYFAAVNSMGSQHSAEMLNQDDSSLGEYYKFATQQALARAGFPQSRSLIVLQAAVLFLTCLRSPKDADFVWIMTAAIYRMAQGLGLHRDGTFFGLKPFDIEMRRRLWWYIYLLDTQSSELRGIDTIITENYDTKLPLNINDSDISPESSDTIPVSHVGFTEMTFCLTRIEIISRCRRSLLKRHTEKYYSNENFNQHDPHLLVLESSLDEIKRTSVFLREHYLRFCDLSIPLHWVTATITRLALSRLWITARFSQRSIAEQLSSIDDLLEDPNRDQLFGAAIEVVDFALLLETDARTRRWSWLFAGYPQWQAVVIALLDICARPRDTETLRAWKVIEEAVSNWRKRDFQECGITMETIFSLMERAARAQGRVWKASNPH